jgi:hypothetical protein
MNMRHEVFTGSALQRVITLCPVLFFDVDSLIIFLLVFAILFDMSSMGIYSVYL